MTRTTQDDPNAAFPGLGGRTGQKRPKDETSAEYYGWLWDEQTAWAAGAGAEVQAPMAAAQPRAEYIQHMLDGRHGRPATGRV